jgi:hypothetical protein
MGWEGRTAAKVGPEGVVSLRGIFILGIGNLDIAVREGGGT